MELQTIYSKLSLRAQLGYNTFYIKLALHLEQLINNTF